MYHCRTTFRWTMKAVRCTCFRGRKQSLEERDCEQHKQSRNHLAESRNRYTNNNDYHAICIIQLYIIVRAAEMKDKLFLVHICFTSDCSALAQKDGLFLSTRYLGWRYGCGIAAKISVTPGSFNRRNGRPPPNSCDLR